jgi:quercetin dioxygenase-like cupin family protein
MIDQEQRLWTAERMEQRIVRYRDLRSCYNAFIDTRSPGSEAKENFTIIGPGVSENPDQHVHIAEPHGFNIGGARQPPQCVNSQHSHDTAEVFVVHSGQWRFDLGEHGEDAQVALGPGDVISLPTRTFRGFTNVGVETGFLWAVLGGDDPGRVTWAPAVFDMARNYGLILLESGRLVDTTRGETIPDGQRPMTPTGPEQVAKLRRFRPEEAEALVARADRLGFGEAPVIGEGAPLGGGHGFSLTRLALDDGESVSRETLDGVEVLFVHSGSLTYRWPGGETELQAGDTVTVPRGLPRGFEAVGATIAYVARGGDVIAERLGA